MLRIRSLLLVMILVVSIAADGLCQSAVVGPRYSERLYAGRDLSAQRERAEPLWGLLGDGSRDHRYDGFFVGAGAAAGLYMLSVASFCGREDATCSAGNLLKAAGIVPIFGILGAFIGGGISK
jgi:hypothetical protein